MFPARAPLYLESRHLAVLAELPRSERARLLVEIRRTTHEALRVELCERLALVEDLAQRAGMGNFATPGEPEECA
jgi:hypothetical protein